MELQPIKYDKDEYIETVRCLNFENNILSLQDD